MKNLLKLNFARGSLLIPWVSQFFYFPSLNTAHSFENCRDSALIAAKVLLTLRIEWNFLIHEGTVVLFDNISDSICLLYLFRFWAVLCRVFWGVIWFFEGPFYIPSDGLRFLSSVQTRAMKKLEQTAFRSCGRSNPCSSSKFLLFKTVLAAVSTTPFRAFSFLASL